MNKQTLTLLASSIIFASTPISRGELPSVTADKAHITTILSIILSTAGALALLMITLSGFRYITAGGNEQKAAKAKNGLTYALVGLVVAVMAQSIVLFVESRLK